MTNTTASAQTDAEYALRCLNLSVTLGGVQILSKVTCNLPTGRLTAVIGPNGAGKTTLLRAILGLIPYHGVVEIGHDTKGQPLKLAYVPQRLDFDRGMPMSVLDFICCALQRRPLWFGHKRQAKDLAAHYLQRVGGRAWSDRKLGKLSGGELQRVLLATALCDQPSILLLDEPVSGVDIAGEELFCDLLASLQDEGKYTMLLVSHDLSIVTEHASHVICLNQTIQCEGDTVEALSADNMKKLYKQDAALYSHHGTHEGHSHHHH